jgi:hypothetical protein
MALAMPAERTVFPFALTSGSSLPRHPPERRVDGVEREQKNVALEHHYDLLFTLSSS